MKETTPDIFDEWLQSRLRQVHTCLPGNIVSYNPVTCKAMVKLLIQFRTPTLDTLLDVPPIDNVPVIFPSTGQFQFIFPLNKGDGVLVLFSEEGIGQFLKSQGTTSVPGDSHARFSLTDAIAIPGLWSDLNIPKNPKCQIIIEDSGEITIHSSGIVRLDSDSGVVLGGNNGFIVTSPTPGPIIDPSQLTAQPKIRG